MSASKNEMMIRYMNSLPEGISAIVGRLRNANIRSDAYYGGRNLDPFMRDVDRLIEAKLQEFDLWGYERERYRLIDELRQARYERDVLRGRILDARRALEERP